MSYLFMKRIMTSERKQGFLFSKHYTCDYLSEDDEVFLYDALIDSLDLKRLYSSYGSERGKMYVPRDKLGVILYAFFKGVTSSRQIAALTTYDIRFVHLSGNHKMGYKSILNFKAKHKDIIEDIFVSSVQVALKSGMINHSEIFAIDGTKLNAYANLNKTKTPEETNEG